MEIEGIAVVHIQRGGHMDYLICGDARFRLFVVDENAPNDRVYEMTLRAQPDEIAKIIGKNPQIGHCKDDRHAGIEARILEALDGKPRLTVVEPDTRS